MLRWFLSKTVRQAADLCHRVEKVLNAQRDVLSPQAVESVSRAVQETRGTIRSGASEKTIVESAEKLEGIANKWLRPYPHAGIRENIDVILVALVVALGIRTFFLQPMAIPTGSMQPTLYGITEENLRDDPSSKIPGFVSRIFQSAFLGTRYYHVKAVEDGVLKGVGPPRLVLPMVKKQLIAVGDRTYTVWFPPDNLQGRAGLVPGQFFRAGEDIVKLKVKSGDRLFADRMTYNFRRPKRGEIIIFESRGIPMLQQDTHYIKRLVALGGERVQISNERHVIINGQPLDASTPRFENIYTFEGPPRESEYSGHVNNLVARLYGHPNLAPLFPNETVGIQIPEKHYLALGDNTMNSFDSRAWGPFPREKVIGKCAFVFWPISPRFGWGFR